MMCAFAQPRICSCLAEVSSSALDGQCMPPPLLPLSELEASVDLTSDPGPAAQLPDIAVRLHLCGACLQPRSSRHRWPDPGTPHYSCLACYLTRQIQQCTQALPERHPEYWPAVRDLLRIHRRLRRAARLDYQSRFGAHSPRHLPAVPPWSAQTEPMPAEIVDMLPPRMPEPEEEIVD